MENTPKNFALQLGSLITLYVSIVSLNVLLFSVITLAFPDAIDSYWTYENASSAIRFSIATLIVFFPAYLILTRLVNQIRRTNDSLYLTLTKWLIYLSLLVGAGVLLGDFVAVIYSWLEGELTVRFLLKAAVLALTLSFALYYYILDARSYWQTHERNSLICGVLALVLVLGSLAMGFNYTETPQEVRDMTMDDRQIEDLQAIQYQIEDYYRLNDRLPENLEEMFIGFEAPTAPEGRTAYIYEVSDKTRYKLCAMFAFDSKLSEYERPMPIMQKNFNWSHGAGEWCFERVVETKATES